MNETRDIEVDINGICRRFREGSQWHPVLVEARARIYRGETVALLGRSGSGKSTLLNLVSGIDLPDRGRITVAGQPIVTLSERERTLFRRRHIGFVYQFFNLIPTLTVEENVRLVVELNRLKADDAANQTAQMLQAVELEERRASYPDTLSGGEQQRVAIARALVHRPLLLLADEPTGNLDDATADQVLDLLARLIRSAGGTMLIATHSASVARFADRILELSEGQLVPHESPAAS